MTYGSLTSAVQITKRITLLREKLRRSELSDSFDNSILVRRIAELQNRRYRILRKKSKKGIHQIREVL